MDRPARFARPPGGAAMVLVATLTAFAASAAAEEGADASVVETRLPGRLQCGRTLLGTATLRNTGATPWTSADALAAVGAGVFSESAPIAIPAGVEVEPGQTYTFRLSLTAPDIALPRARAAWRMVDGDGVSFGETVTQSIPVVCPPRIDDAEILETALPTRLACGEAYELRVEVRNTGSVAWSAADGYALGAVEGGFHAPSRIGLGEPVPPGGVHTFAARLVAPAEAGSYRLEWRMMRAGAGFFGPSIEQPLRVACPPRADARHGRTP